jgi:hypothetical protein
MWATNTWARIIEAVSATIIPSRLFSTVEIYEYNIAPVLNLAFMVLLSTQQKSITKCNPFRNVPKCMLMRIK